jgi:F0F1-type ATP synthase assembly protein I
MRVALRILSGQTTATALLALFSLWWSTAHAVSALAGGSVAIAAYASVTFWVFRAQSGTPAAELARLYAAGIVKLAIAAILFGVIFATRPPAEPLACFVAFLIVQWVPALAGGNSCSPDCRLESKHRPHGRRPTHFE